MPVRTLARSHELARPSGWLAGLPSLAANRSRPVGWPSSPGLLTNQPDTVQPGPDPAQSGPISAQLVLFMWAWVMFSGLHQWVLLMNSAI